MNPHNSMFNIIGEKMCLKILSAYHRVCVVKWFEICLEFFVRMSQGRKKPIKPGHKQKFAFLYSWNFPTLSDTMNKQNEEE